MIHVDARGMRCPWPVLRLARAMRAGDGVTILADDPAAPGEIRALAEAQGWRIAAIEGGFTVTRAA
ncbi:sulfurtransferase TusA family protein [Sphingomonas sp.]|uniref:sulfurtransferase TusA family protein n=1 Tax=Sphingomonas sp. TaxID=28214 RepID=UPI003B3B6F93